MTHFLLHPCLLTVFADLIMNFQQRNSLLSYQGPHGGGAESRESAPNAPCLMWDSPVSCSVHGSQRRQVVRAAQVSVQPVLSGRQVSGGGRAGGRGEELHGDGVVGGVGAGVHSWTTNKDG